MTTPLLVNWEVRVVQFYSIYEADKSIEIIFNLSCGTLVAKFRDIASIHFSIFYRMQEIMA